MLPRVFRAQLRRPCKGDWPQLVEKDLEDFGIKLSFDQIKKTKKDTFKKIVTEACKRYSFIKLMKLKEGKNKTKGKSYITQN